MKRMKRIVIMISGRGSNMEAIINATNTGKLDAEVVGVISNNPSALGLAIAKENNIPIYIALKSDFDATLNSIFDDLKPDVIFLAGFMQILSANIVNKWKDIMMNIHPSILPAFKGLNTHQRAIDAGELIHGCTVHMLTADVDSGAVVDQSTLCMEYGESVESLSDRVLELEHKLCITAIRIFFAGKHIPGKNKSFLN